MPKMLTIQAAATEAGLTYSTVRRWIISGKFKGYVMSGTKYLINRDLFIEFLSGVQNEE